MKKRGGSLTSPIRLTGALWNAYARASHGHRAADEGLVQYVSIVRCTSTRGSAEAMRIAACGVRDSEGETDSVR
jgi:hypothetical protein